MTRLDYAAIRAVIPIRPVLELIDYQPVARRDQQWRGPCPFACATIGPRQRHFSIHLGRNIFRCFHCGRSGNQLDLWAALTGLDLHPATLDLCHRLRIAAAEVHNSQPEDRHF